ncbi:hypothetical protein [Qipengyuania flava]|uniref:hypothetical protein n=1 Tax=Qipengyuania flava TaxID=192812 RepID=UPI000EEA7FED|nr:hypothetical protein [Qipengyuania flava]MCA0889200.1 hypothetical protein [Qipengyuania flava]HCS17624.1 hypothetical protein [Erythrobacter sp.]
MKYYYVIAAALLSFFTPTVAQACSVVDDYRVPTNLELTGQSELILRGRVIGEVEGESSWDGKLLVEPLMALKGEMPKGTVEISGARLVPMPDERGFGLLSNPYQLEGAHPLSYIGGCLRYMFPKGTTVLFFLEEREGEWSPSGGPFSRWAEDVLDADSPWIRLSRFYASVPTDDATRRKTVLEAERDRLWKLSEDPVAALMAQDIERQLVGPNEPWNAIMRKAIEGEAEAPAGAEGEVAAEALASLIMEAIAEDDYETTCFTDQNGDEVCEAEVTLGAQADVMEEELGMVCDLLDDRRKVDCDGVRYVRESKPS